VPFPEVAWWGALSHQSVSEYVDRRYGGDWAPYVASWQRQLDKLRDIRKRDSAAAIMARTDKGREKKVLRGGELDKYIELVSIRLTVMRCLADRAKATKPPAKAARPKPRGIALKARSVAAGGEKAKALGCLKCHGESPAPPQRGVPNLAGQNELYLIRQLKEFQTPFPKKDEPLGAGGRHNRIMKARAGDLSDKDIWNLSAYFNSLPACPGGKTGPGARPVPATVSRCVECHGPDGNSVFPDVPNLTGQENGYLLKQLYAFRRSADGKSKGAMINSRYHYFMSSITKTMSDADLKGLAEYYSRAGCGR